MRRVVAFAGLLFCSTAVLAEPPTPTCPLTYRTVMIRAETAMMNEAAEGTRILDFTGDGLDAILRVLNNGKKGEPFVAEHLVVFERLQHNSVKMGLFHDGCAIWMNTEVSGSLWKQVLDDAFGAPA
jgi:hypothetical protein